MAQSLKLISLDEKRAYQLCRRLKTGLSQEEVSAVRAYFKKLGRDPSEIELHTIAQTWFPYFISLIRERFGSYQIAMGVVFALAALGALAIVLLPRRAKLADPVLAGQPVRADRTWSNLYDLRNHLAHSRLPDIDEGLVRRFTWSRLDSLRETVGHHLRSAR